MKHIHTHEKHTHTINITHTHSYTHTHTHQDTKKAFKCKYADIWYILVHKFLCLSNSGAWTSSSYAAQSSLEVMTCFYHTWIEACEWSWDSFCFKLKHYLILAPVHCHVSLLADARVMCVDTPSPSAWCCVTTKRSHISWQQLSLHIFSWLQTGLCIVAF